MRLLQCGGAGGYHLTKSFTKDEAIPPYAILSHTWGLDGDEVTFSDLTNGNGTPKPGYEKIRFCAAQARQDGLDHFWIDSCCINQEDKAELSNAINSMFRWYRNADRCYVYLSDVSTAKRKANSDISEWESAFRRSKWFTRGWTLQELLAPRTVEFFSQQRKWLGNKDSLRQRIHEITGIPGVALQGELLSQFSVNDRLSWIEHRETKRDEDKAYSLLGIFGVYMPPIYGEGIGRAFTRLQEEIKKLEECTRDLHVTDPRRDKARIEETKGGLLEESYCWIFQNPDFLRWRDDPQGQLLWIKGDPGKGKTMLLCGIINELSKSMAKTTLFSYFFTQATDSRINSATAVLRGLLFMLVNQQPVLISHLRKKHDQTGKALFEDANAWVVLCEIFTDILQDSTLDNVYFFIDALDECVKDLEKLLAFIVQKSSLSPRVKWILTSRNYANIEQRLRLDNSGARLSLELKENAAQVSRAVNAYIDHRLIELEQIQHNQPLRLLVREKMQQKANGTFLWVSLVIKELKDAQSWEVLRVLEEVPTELTEVYRRMMEHIKQLKRRNPELCRHILSTVVATYRPLHLQELCVLADLPNQGHNVEETTAMMVKMCGSFLTLREDYVYVVHQSAKDFLSDEAALSVFPSEAEEVHRDIFSRSIQAMSGNLRRNIYQLDALGYPIEQLQQPKPDPLVALRYSCIYWIDHLCEWISNSSTYDGSILMSAGVVDGFMRKKYLYWLEAVSLCTSLSKGVVSMSRLETLTEERAATSSTLEVVRDARRFLMYHKSAIESSPLQAYGALLFSPTRSVIRALFKDEEPQGITIKPGMQDQWSNCLSTLEGHSDYVTSVAFSHDSARIASASWDKTIKIWDASSGEHLHTLKGHSEWVNSVAFSYDSTQIASASWDNTAKIWDASSCEHLHTLEGHSDIVNSVAFSHDSTRIASGSYDETVKIWDASSGEHLQTLEGHSRCVTSVAFSHDSARIASGSYDETIKIWDASSGEHLQTLEGHSSYVTSVAFSHDSARIASASWDKTIKIWDASSGEHLHTLEDHSKMVNSVAFSHDSTRIASGSDDMTVKIWDARIGKHLHTLKGHNHKVASVTFSHDSTRIASSSENETIMIWDASISEYQHMLEGHSDWVSSVAFSHNSTQFASASHDNTVKIWDASSGEHLHTLKGHSHGVTSVAFSHDSTRIASGSNDKTVKIWDASSWKHLHTLKGHSSFVSLMAFSHDSTLIASGSCDESVKIWDVSSGEHLQTLEGHSDLIYSVAFSHDSAQVASTSDDKIIKIWDVSSGKHLHTLEGHSDLIYSVAFSHDSTQIASASNDETVKIWDTSNGEHLHTLQFSWQLYNFLFRSTGFCLNSTMLNGTTVMINPLSPQYQYTALYYDGPWIGYNSKNVLRLPPEHRPTAFDMSGNFFVGGTGDGKVWIYNLML